ncbi:EmrB/QacA subfamily drug resistance transporter [Propionibacteriaceae bacterium ES.041]|nr:EmrB/QacA subfamily drug resistance transporter [Propionibacteriaceae bacterium ES.041]
MTTQATQERESAQAWPALWSLLFGFFMILVDQTIVSIATPALMQGLQADVGMVVWVTSAYLLAFAVPLLITGRLGDRFGPKNLYLIGLTVFTLASAACGFAPNIEVLIVARVVQGLGAAMMTPQTMAFITRLFPAHRRGAAMGIWGATAGVATLIGPLLGGVLVDGLGWRWIFFVNLPVGLIGFWMVLRNAPALEKHQHRFDLVGVVLSAVGMFCLVFGIEEGSNYDWGTITGPISVWGLIITGVVVMALFVVWQAKQRGEPLVPLDLFKDRNFSAANLGIASMGAMVTSMVFPMMLYTQNIRGLTPTLAALLTLPMAVASGALAPLAGKLIDRHDPKWYAVAGFVLMGAGLVIQALVIRPGWSVLWLLLPAFLIGVANAGIWGPLSVSATRNLPPHRAGAGAGVYNTTRQLGAVLGSAGIATAMQSRITAEMAAGGPPDPAAAANSFTLAMGQATLLPAAIALIGLIAVLMLEPPRPRGTMER